MVHDGWFQSENPTRSRQPLGAENRLCLPRWRMTCWVDPQSLVLVAPNEAPRESGTKQRGSFFGHRAEMGGFVWFPPFADADRRCSSLVERSRGGNEPLYVVPTEGGFHCTPYLRPVQGAGSRTTTSPGGGKKGWKNQELQGSLSISRPARCRLMTASASNFKPAEMEGQCNSRCRGRLYFDLIGSLGGGRRAEARGHVPWLSPNGCGRVPVAPAVTNSSPPRRRVCDHRREGRASNPDGGASLSQPAQPW